MNQKKICFIICLYNEDQLAQILSYLEKLQIPVGYVVDTLILKNVDSEAKAYQEAMQSNDAKYKIYIDENIRIQYGFFLDEIIKAFLGNPKLGMIGVSGNLVIPANGILLNGKKRVGRIYNSRIEKDFIWGQCQNDVEIVAAIDGWLMATQVDIDWRSDLFFGNYGYDLAQNIEFQKKGYVCAVIQQANSWCEIYLEKINFLQSDMNKFLKEYGQDIFPLISILIPTFNRPEYLKIALESVLKQNYWNLEIIISDNSDNDLTEQMLKPYMENDKRIKYFSHRNVGYGFEENWNWLMEYPSAAYINWLMDDDFFYEGKLSTMMTYYLENENISLVTSSRNIVDSDGRLIRTIQNFSRSQILKGEEFGKEMLVYQGNFVGEPTTTLLKKEFLLNGRLGWRNQLDEKYHYSAIIDVETWLHLCSVGDIVYIAEPLSAFRNHEGQDQKKMDVLVSAWTDWYELIEYAYNQKVFLINQKELGEAKKHYKIMAQKILDEANQANFYKGKKDLLIKYLYDTDKLY